MPFLRQNTGDPELPTQPAPGLYYCNAPWVAIGDDHTIYAGGSVFTPLGDRNWYPGARDRRAEAGAQPGHGIER
jgi:hypothetical protein